MNHIFISYSRKNERQVTAFVERLRQLDLEVWQDITGKRSGIPYSVKWFEVIEEAVFTASAAIIFNTEPWERSVPCQQEFQLIQDTALPFLYLSIDRLSSDEDAVIDEAARWCVEQIASKENSYCRWMVSGAYRVYKKLPIEAYFPTGKQLVRSWLWLRKCRQIAAETVFQGPWTGSLKLFLRKAKRKLLGDAAVRALVGLSILSMAVVVLAAVDVFRLVRVTNDTTGLGAVITSELQRIGEYDPVQAMRTMEEYCGAIGPYTQNSFQFNKEYMLKNYGDKLEDAVRLGYFFQSRILADLVSRNYPVEFYESMSDCPVDLSSITAVQTSSRYTISLSDDTSQIFVYDSVQNTVNQLLLSAVPQVYCLNGSGELLAAAAENEVYVYDLSGSAPPRLLTYNFENIRDLLIYEGRIYAVTENDRVVVWDNPLLEKKVHREAVASGALIQLDSGQVMAVYADDDCLVKNIDNREERCPFPFGVMDRDNIAVSSDGAYAAVSYRPDQSETDWIGLVDLADGTLTRTYDTGCEIVGYVFSGDNEFLTITCFNKNKIARINLSTGEMQESAGETYSSPYSLVVYDGNTFVCDNEGFLAVYDGHLELAGDYRAIGYPAPQRQLAVSPRHTCLLTAGRGGNTLGGAYQTSLFNGKQDVFLTVDEDPMMSTMSVAVTDGGDYAAYGTAGGSIYIWDVELMGQVWNKHCISESIISLLFSHDADALYALGGSGTVYKLDILGVLSNCVPGQQESVLRMQMDTAAQIKQNMYDFGLFFDK